MKLDRDIKFKADFIMPICLPEADDKSDILKKKGKYLYVLLRTIDVHKQKKLLYHQFLILPYNFP